MLDPSPTARVRESACFAAAVEIDFSIVGNNRTHTETFGVNPLDDKLRRTAMIDMHAHWRPAELIDALRARTKEPRIVRNQDGIEVVKSRIGEEPVSKAFDDVEFHLARMDRQGVSTSALSLPVAFVGIDARQIEVALPL